MSNQLFLIRPAQPTDYAFIYHSWLKSYRDSPAVRSIPNTQFYAGQHALIERLLPLSVVRVACSHDKHTEIYGYIVAQAHKPGLTIHWVYVKHPFRGFGIAKALESTLSGSITAYTHRVKNMDRLLKDRSYVFNPYLLHGFSE